MTKKIEFAVPSRGPFSDTIASLNKMIVEWDYQQEIRLLLEQVIELKKQHGCIIAGDENYNCYPSISGYLQAVVTIVGSKRPPDVIVWLTAEKSKLETELPFLMLKYTGTK